MTRRQLLIVILATILLFSLLACWSTACMTNAELLDFVNGATPVPCFR